METETKIAKENVEEVIKYERMDDPDNERAKTHKQTCQRWLEFLSAKITIKGWNDENRETTDNLVKKITDLKQAIKIYDENEI